MIMADDILSAATNQGKGTAGNPKSTAATKGGGSVKPYDPSIQKRMVRERLYALEFINERFSRQFRMGLLNSLQLSADITAGELKIHPYHEFAKSLPVLTNLNLVQLKPLRGHALFVFEPGMVFTAVDKLFGGDGRFPAKVEGREFTSTEQRVIHRMLTIAMEAYQYAWSTVYRLDAVNHVRSEIRSKFTHITASPNDPVISTAFKIEIGTLIGECSICIPFSMMDPLRELLTNPQVSGIEAENHHWRRMLSKQLQNSELELVAHFVDIPLLLSQILKLKPDDMLSIERPQRLVGHVNNVPVLTAQYGTLNGQYALRIEQLINPILNDRSEESPE